MNAHVRRTHVYVYIYVAHMQSWPGGPCADHVTVCIRRMRHPGTLTCLPSKRKKQLHPSQISETTLHNNVTFFQCIICAKKLRRPSKHAVRYDAHISAKEPSQYNLLYLPSASMQMNQAMPPTEGPISAYHTSSERGSGKTFQRNQKRGREISLRCGVAPGPFTTGQARNGRGQKETRKGWDTTIVSQNVIWTDHLAPVAQAP